MKKLLLLAFTVLALFATTKPITNDGDDPDPICFPPDICRTV